MIQWLVDEAYPEVEVIRLVQDNLNTHLPGSLHDTFEPTEARRLLRKLEFHYTPVHGSWLNMAEIELAILSSQCLDRGIPDTDALRAELVAWEATRNETATQVHWRFTSTDARIKLRHLYPSYGA